MRRFVDLFRSKKNNRGKDSLANLVSPGPPARAVSPETASSAVSGATPLEPASSTRPPGPPPGGPVAETASDGAKDIEGKVVEILRDTFDPEIPVNIYELGLVYEVRVEDPGVVCIRMTLTSPACPVAGSLPPEVASRVRTVPGVTDVRLDLVWDPPWNPNMMSEAARLQLGMM